MTDAYRVAADAATNSYGRLLAFLSRRWRDIAAAEDALGDAFAEALDCWPRVGVPNSPEAWLLTVARRRLTDAARRSARHDKLFRRLAVVHTTDRAETAAIPDERLNLLFVCAHPAIDTAVRSALMLQTVLGIPTRTLASAFLLSNESLAKRLVRAKRRVRDAGIPFEPPEASELADRLHAVLEAVYAAYFLGRDGAAADCGPDDALRGHALALANLIRELVPESAEAIGFLALLAFCESRLPAQVSDVGEFVPLLEQDTWLWNRGLMRQGYELVERAAGYGRPGPFQIEAAIHAAHCYRARSGATPWAEIAVLYDRLVDHGATIGALVSRAVAHAHAGDRFAVGLRLLDSIPASRVAEYQPYWVARSHLLDKVGLPHDAARCMERGIGLTSQPRVRRYLLGHLAAINRNFIID